MDKGHGRIEERRLWVLPVDGAAVGFPGAAQVFRIDRRVDTVRQGRVIKTTPFRALPPNDRPPFDFAGSLARFGGKFWFYIDNASFL